MATDAVVKTESTTNGAAVVVSSQPTSEASKILTEGIVLLLGTAAAYAGCYVYEAAYAGYFNIPYEFITLNVQNLLYLGFSFFVASLSGFQIINYYFSYFHNNDQKDSPIWLILTIRWTFLFMALLGLLGISEGESSVFIPGYRSYY